MTSQHDGRRVSVGAMYDPARDAWADRDSDAAWPRRNNHHYLQQDSSSAAQKTQAVSPVHAVYEQVSSVMLYLCCLDFTFVLRWWSRWLVAFARK